MTDRYICRDWREPTPRPWLPAINAHERNSRAALIDKRPEPGFWATLAAFTRCNRRTWMISVALTAGVLLALVGKML